jgi:hypothetical protein
MRLGLVVLLGVAGCGGRAFDTFLGTWAIQPGSQVVAMCPAPIGTQTTNLEGNIQVLPSVTADLVTPDQHGCDVTYKVTGTVATGTGNLTCTHPAANAANTTETDTTTMITLTTTDGKSMTESATGMAVFMAAGGTLTCPFTITATLTKASNEP